MLVSLSCDEYYPWYSLSEDPTEGYKLVEFPDEEWDQYVRVCEQVRYFQNKISALD